LGARTKVGGLVIFLLLLESSQLRVDEFFPLAVIHSHDRPSAAELEPLQRLRFLRLSSAALVSARTGIDSSSVGAVDAG
jgi:hypothetical protein